MNLAVQLNDTVAQQLALEEEDAGLKLALSNITSSFHQLAPSGLMDVRTSSDTGQVHPNNYTMEVSVDRLSIELEALNS